MVQKFKGINMAKAKVINLVKQFAKLTFVGDRTPESTDAQLAGAFLQLSLIHI